MNDQKLLEGKELLEAIKESGKTRFADLPQNLQDSIEKNVPAEARLRGLSFVNSYLQTQIDS